MEWILLSSLLGLLIGSFLNVVILRYPQMLEQSWRQDCNEHFKTQLALKEFTFNLVTPRSHCPFCLHTLRFFENIPIISFLFLKGRCAACKHQISWRYPFVELLTAIFSGIVAWHFGFHYALLGGLFFTWFLIVLSVIDIDHQLLPDTFTFLLLWVGIIFNLFETFCTLEAAIIGAIAGYLFLWSVYFFFKLMTHKEGMGRGDFKLLAAIGAWTGWSTLPFIVLIASALGALCGLILILSKRHSFYKPIPFGPFLAIAGWIGLLWGDKIKYLYSTLSHLS